MCFSIAVAAVIAAAVWSALAQSARTWQVAGVAAGAGAIGPDVAGGWCSGWCWLARVARGDRMVLALAQSVWTWPVAGAGAYPAAGAGHRVARGTRVMRLFLSSFSFRLAF